MANKAILITGQESETESTLARNLIPVGGITLLERQLKLLKRYGVEEVHLITDWFVSEFEKAVLSYRNKPEKVFIHRTKEAPVKLLESNHELDRWLLLEEGVLVDDRILGAVAGHESGSVIAVMDRNYMPEEKASYGIPLSLRGEETIFASVALISGQTMQTHADKLNSLETLKDALEHIAVSNDCEIFNISSLPLYLANRRRDVEILWLPILNKRDGEKGTEALLQNAQKGTLDWPAWFIHRPIENWIVKNICNLPITPNQVTVATGILGFYIMYLFATGQMGIALAGALVVGVLDGVDGKLARTKLMQTKIGEIEHVVDKVVEYGWYFAIGGYLSTLYGFAPWVFAGALVLFHLADEIQAEFFRRMSDRQICDAGAFDRKFRLIGGRRNTQMWALIPFGLFGAWYAGFIFICAYGIITFFVHQIRIIYHAKNLMEATSEEFVKTFQKTKIF
ncbi:CDP-alcohol phosphatidyltransferase family protein [Luteithermobacter gelatinilyticus]|uniref:CDP-alcohol phosphatidyltransferase family protein n=1 Tax=Luteithermobacter gelatinilyticus TaxID=2582913 RepID=UPI00110636D8|nr:CDP-alcohol phosphatidyltransferase family protein [Luteithermobacter gelatinilyticus]